MISKSNNIVRRGSAPPNNCGRCWKFHSFRCSPIQNSLGVYVISGGVSEVRRLVGQEEVGAGDPQRTQHFTWGRGA